MTRGGEVNLNFEFRLLLYWPFPLSRLPVKYYKLIIEVIDLRFDFVYRIAYTFVGCLHIVALRIYFPYASKWETYIYSIILYCFLVLSFLLLTVGSTDKVINRDRFAPKIVSHKYLLMKLVLFMMWWRVVCVCVWVVYVLSPTGSG